MKIKIIPEDFIVNEIYNLDLFKEKKEEGRENKYYYFILKKINYGQIRAIEKVAKIFNTSRKLVHFAGTKDKVGITTQIISVFGIKESNFEKNLEFFNEKVDDLFLEFLGKFDGRVNLGDNLGNSFEIIVRDLDERDVGVARENILNLSESGVMNFFDSQRFGYANNSHIVGKFVLKNEIEKAVFTVLTSLPKNPKENHTNFVCEITEKWDNIKEGDEEIINNIMVDAPRFLRDEVQVLKHLKKYKNDFPGAFRKIHKKVRTLYVNAYQSYIFNETIIKLKEIEKIDKYNEIPLINSKDNEDEILSKINLELISKDKVSLSDFELKSMPELMLNNYLRKVKIYPKNIVLGDVFEDDMNEDRKKINICFELSKGEYATNVVKQLFLSKEG